MRVKEIMTGAIEACRPATDLAAVAMTMWRQDCGFVPVVDEENRVAGVITDRDICMALATRHRRPEELTAQDAMSRPLFTVHPDDDVREALEVMQTRRVRRLPVVDAEARLRGILSINDVVLHARPSAARSRAEISANAVLAALQGICEHRPAPRQPVEREEPVAAHA